MRLMSMPSLYGSKGGHVYHPSPIPVKEFLEATVELTADQPLHIVASRSAVPSSSPEGYRIAWVSGGELVKPAELWYSCTFLASP